MKRQLLGMMLLSASMFFLGSCGEANRVDELKEFVEKVQKEGSTYTEKQWEEVNQEFTELMEKLNNYEDLSADELHEIAKLQGEYAATAFKEHAGKAMDKAGAVLEGFLEGLTDEENNQETEDDSK